MFPTPAAAPARDRRAPIGARVGVALLAVLVAVLVVFAWGRSVSAQVAPSSFGWQFQDLDGPGVAGGDGRSSEPVLPVGSSSVVYAGQSHVFYESSGLLRHAWFVPSLGQWFFETLDGDGGGNGRTSNAVGSGSSVVVFGPQLSVFYVDADAGVLRHSWYTPEAGWFAQSLDGPSVDGGAGRTSNRVGGETSVALFAAGPHVFYRDEVDADLRHAWWDGTQWYFETLDGDGGGGGRVSGDIAVGDAAVAVPGSPAGLLQVFYRDASSQRLRQAGFLPGPGWQYRDLDGPGVTGGNGRQEVPTGIAPSALVFGGEPHVFYGNADSQLRQAWASGPAGTWNFATLQSPADCGECLPGIEPSAGLYNGLPQVAHHDADQGRLLLTSWSGTAWVNEALDGPGVAGGAGRTSDNVGLSSSIVQFGNQLSIFNVDVTESRLRQAWFGPAPPTNLVPPTVTGTVAVGATVSATTGTWVGAPTGFAYQWQRCVVVVPVGLGVQNGDPSCSDIPGATAATYTVTDADIASALTVRVTATNVWGTRAATALETDPVPWPAPVVTSLDPTSGPDLGGTTVTIDGNYFADVESVTFGGVEATILEGTTTRLTVTSPPGTAGPADVVVTTATGESAPLVFTYFGPPVNTESPEITGTVAVGETLSATTGTWTNSPDDYTYQWQRCAVTPDLIGASPTEPTCADIDGATESTYTVTDDDITSSLQVVVVATNAAGDSTPATSVTTLPVPWPAPVVDELDPTTGEDVGGTSVVITGKYFADVVDVNFGGAAALSIVVDSPTQITAVSPPSEPGQVFVVVTTATGSSSDPAVFTYELTPPVNETPPMVTGTAEVGQELTADPGAWTNEPSEFAYQWQRCDVVPNGIGASPTEPTCADIDGATESTYTVTDDDITSSLQVVVVATNAAGDSTPATSVTTLPVPWPAPVVTELDVTTGPTVGGTTVVITGNYFADVDSVTFADADATILEATTTQFTVTSPPGTAGPANVVVTTATGSSTPLVFTYFGPPANVTPPEITGTAEVGETLTADPGTWTNEPTGYSYQWQRCGLLPLSCEDIDGATESTYVVTDDDITSTLQVVVVATDATGDSEPATSATTPPVPWPAPLAASLEPTSGPDLGGTTVVIAGEYFADVTDVTFGAVSATSFEVDSSTQITAVSPPGTAGPVDVVVTTATGTSNALVFTYELTPPVKVTPPMVTGTAEVGETLTADPGTWTNEPTGYSYQWQRCPMMPLPIGIGALPSEATCADIDGATESTYVVTYEDIMFALQVVVVASNSAGDGEPAASAATPPVPWPAPLAASLEPTSGPDLGGTTVVITGLYFADVTDVTFGAVSATSFEVDSSTQITAVSPPGTAGPVDVVVTTATGSSTPLVFTYTLTPPVNETLPSANGTAEVGEMLTADPGTWTNSPTSYSYQWQRCGLSPLSCVDIDGATESTYEVTDEDITFALQVVVVASNAAGDSDPATSATTLPVPWPTPTITSVVPNAGPLAGAPGVVITGKYFTDVQSVTFGGTPVTELAVDSATQITVTTPPAAAGAVAVTVTTATGSVTEPAAYTYFNPPTFTLSLPAAGPQDGGQTVTVLGGNFVPGLTTVTVNDVPATVTSVGSFGEFVVFTTPPGAVAGPATVVVTTPGGSVNATYTYLAAPTITSLTPTEGPTTGGQSVTLTGTDLNIGGTSVTVGGAAATGLVVSATQITFTTPAGAAGLTDVVVTTGGGSATDEDGYEYFDEPTITDIDPDEGPIAGGTEVTVTGSGFSATNTTVTVGAVPVTPTNVTASSFTFVTPENQPPGAVDVEVTTPGGTVTAEDGFTYFAPPTIETITPNQGPEGGDQSVTVTGTNFVDSGTFLTIVKVGGTTASEIVVASPTSLSFKTPAGTPGPVDVEVTTAGGPATAEDGYTYLPAPTVTEIDPNEGPLGGGQLVTVTGTNLDIVDLTVTVDGEPGIVDLMSITPGSFQFTTPPGSAGTVDVKVSTLGGDALVEDGYTYFDEPAVPTIDPVDGPVAGGTPVTLTSTNLSLVEGNTTVLVGGLPATNVVVTSTTELTFDTPDFTEFGPGAAAVVVVAPGGFATLLDGFTYYAEPTVTLLDPNSGATAGDDDVTLTGSGFSPTGATMIADPTNITVTIDGKDVTDLVVVSDSELTFRTPERDEAGPVDVKVTTPGGDATLSPGYEYFYKPVITDIDPAEGPTTGGETVTVTGANFAFGITRVRIGGIDVTASVTNLTESSLEFVTPLAQPAGLVVVEVETPGGFATEVDGYEYFDAPTITTIVPDQGPEAGGTDVTVTGTNFVNVGFFQTKVTVGGAPVEDLVVTDAENLTFTTPAGTGAADVVVTTAGGVATADGGFTYRPVPTIETVSPTSGPQDGGQTVTVTGTGFVVGSTDLEFDGSDGTSVTVDPMSGGTSLTVVTPSGTPGPADVTVTTPGGDDSLPGGYTYLPEPAILSVTPNEGTTAGFTPVALAGTNLDVAGLSVTVGGAPVIGLSVVFPGTLVVFNTPPRPAGPADVVVTTNGGTATLTGGFTYYDAPTITDIDPAFGPLAGGTDVTLNGTNFSSNTTVTVGGAAVTGLTRVSSTELTFTTPARPAGPADVVVTALGGTTTGTFTYLPEPTVTSVTPAEGPEAGGGDPVTVAGTGFVVGETAVSFGDNLVDEADVTVESDTSLTVVAPAGEPGTVAVTVTTPGGEGELADAYTYLPAPTIEGIDPDEGPTSGGTTVVLTGTDLDVAGLVVTVGGTPATEVVPVSATEITFTTPPGAAGPADVVVTTDGGSAELEDGFTYLPPAVTVVETAGGAGQFMNSTATAIGPGGGMVTTGGFTGTVTFGTGEGAASLTAVGPNDVFVASYNAVGDLQWARQAGGTGSNVGLGVAVTPNGSVVVTGNFAGTATFGTGGEAVTLTSAGDTDVFVSSYDVAGVLQWAVSAGGTGLDQGNAVSVGTNGTIAVTGPFSGMATFGAGQPNVTTLTSAGSQDVFVATYAATGELQWVTRAGGTSSDEGRGVAVGSDGSIAVTGDFSGTASFGAVVLTAVASDQVFVASYEADGALKWANQAVGNDNGVGRSVDIASDGSVVVSGDFRGTETFGTGGDAVTLVSTPDDFFGDPSQDIFVASYTAAGVLEWAVQAGGPGLDNNRGVAVDADGSATITGYFSSGFFTNTATFGSGPSAVTLTGNGNNVYVATYDADGDLESAYKVDGNGGLLGNGVAAADGAVVVTGTFSNPNTTFCDDAGGGFAPCGGTLESPVTKTPAGDGDMFLLRIGDAVPAPPVPVNTAVPTVTGTAEIGETLETDNGTWDNGPLMYAYRWQRCDAEGADCTDVAGATSATYTATADDGGSTLRAAVVAANGGGLSEPAFSAATAVVPPPPPPPALLENVVQTDAGGYHTCAVVDDDGVEDAAGTVRCWGANGVGQLGNGSTDPSSTTPVVVAGITTAVEVSLGGNHSCARLADGTVRCWGLNGSGQLGDGTTADSSVPVTVLSAPATPLSGVQRLAAGGNHTCAVLADGTVRCWGANDSGQLGNNSTVNSSVPVTVGGILAGEAVSAVSAGFAHTCALLADGTLACWGLDFLGQLGNPASAGGISTVPVPVEAAPGVPLTNVDDVSAGGEHTCAVLGAGTARCWGANYFGQLGNGTSDFNENPVPVVVTGLSGADEVSLGDAHSCARLADGTLRCWGWNVVGQLGNNSIIDSDVPVTVVDIGTGVEVTAGALHSCALLADGTVRCWGYNVDGQLGNGSTTESSVPVAVIDPPSAPVNVAPPVISGTAEVGEDLSASTGTWAKAPSGFTYEWQRCDAAGDNCVAIAEATASTYTLTGEDEGATLRVVVTASNELGETGATSAQTAVVVSPPPPGLENVVQSDAGSFHTCAVVDDDGVEDGAGGVRCWGQNAFGKLGNDSQLDSADPVAVTGLDTAVEVSAGGSHSCARLADGTVRCWGRNVRGELGDGTTTNSSVPVTVLVAPATPLSGVVRIAAGDEHTCAVLEDGSVRCWGYNASGRLGDGTTTNSSVPVTVVVAPGVPLLNVDDVAAGALHTCALLGDGTVRCWGSNQFGQLGNSGGTSTVAVPVDASPGVPLANVDDVSAAPGGLHTCALMIDDTVRCWGSNGSGQLGDGTNSFTPVTVPVQVTGITNAVEISAGGSHSCALLPDETVRCWGGNNFGGLGTGNTTGSFVPVEVTGLSDAVEVTAGGSHTCAVLDNTQMQCWGYNAYGQVGNGVLPEDPFEDASVLLPVGVVPVAAPPD